MAAAYATARDPHPPAGPTMEQLHRLVDRIAAGDINVLILGETGVGKEVMAERVHRQSPRSALPFLGGLPLTPGAAQRAARFVREIQAAVEDGLRLPIVFNTSGYDRVETLALLDGVVDIYMPDFKYTASAVAARYSQAADYPEVVKEAIKEMHRQVGDLAMDERGIARRGLLVRHLVLPAAKQQPS